MKSIIADFLEYSGEMDKWRAHHAGCRTQDDFENHFFKLRMAAWKWAHDWSTMAHDLESLLADTTHTQTIAANAALLTRIAHALKGQTHVNRRAFTKRIASHQVGAYARASASGRAGGKRIR